MKGRTGDEAQKKGVEVDLRSKDCYLWSGDLKDLVYLNGIIKVGENTGVQSSWRFLKKHFRPIPSHL